VSDSDREVAERRLGQLVGGKWRLERLLGTGGMAAVYAAVAGDGTRAAVKMLHPEMTLKRDVRERFVREGYVGNRVQHPGAVRILEHGESEGEAFLVMELLDGEPLGERVRKLGALPPAEILGYMDQVLDVLATAHEQGIIHRDIKPDNLFVSRDGRVKILDFGLARMLDDVPGEFKTRTGLALGTLPYMAPEQALGKRAQLDGRVDLFALGATAFRILSKRRVHEADSEAELLVAMATKPVEPLASVAPDVPASVCAIVDHSLAFNKDARYPDARTMQADVRAVLAGGEPTHAARALGAGRDMPTRIDRAAPVAPGAAGVATSSAASLPSVPHAIAAGARAAGTAVMPASGLAAPDAPTRAELPAAAPLVATAVAAAADVAPLSAHGAVSAHTAPGYDAAPPSAAFAASSPALPGAAPRPVSQPPPAKKSGVMPIVLLLTALLVVLGVVAIGALVITGAGGLFGEEPTAAAEPAPSAAAAAVPAPAASSETASVIDESQLPETGQAGDGPKPGTTTATRGASTAAKPTKPPQPPTAPTSTAAGKSAPTATAAPPPPPPAPAPAPAAGVSGQGSGNRDRGRGNDKDKDKHKDKDKGKGKDH
jgi:serine/threonine-protein kinase